MNKLHRYYKQHRLFRIASQVLIFFLIYMGVRYWQSLDNIQGQAPVIVAQTISGKAFDLRETHAKPILVHFWATWCPICNLENSNIAALAQDYQVITIASWSEGKQQVMDFMQEKNLKMPVIVDEDGEWAKLYNVKSVPASFIIDTQGDIQFIEKGYSSEMGLRLRLWWLQ